MSYTKQTWATGDTITADKLNHMEDGITNASGFMMVSASIDESTHNEVLDKTWIELKNALESGKICVFTIADESEEGYIITNTTQFRVAMQSEGLLTGYLVYIYPTGNDMPVTYLADSEDDYPSILPT